MNFFVSSTSLMEVWVLVPKKVFQFQSIALQTRLRQSADGDCLPKTNDRPRPLLPYVAWTAFNKVNSE